MNNLAFYGKMTMGDFMYIRNILDDDTYLNEYIRLCSMEWGDNKTNKEMEEYVEKKKEKIKTEDKVILVLGLFDTSELVGFISFFKYDGDEMKDLTPWYATMYVKRQYRGKGYSKDALKLLIREAYNNGIEYLYDTFEKDRENALKLFLDVGFEIYKEETWKKFNKDVSGIIVRIKTDNIIK